MTEKKCPKPAFFDNEKLKFSNLVGLTEIILLKIFPRSSLETLKIHFKYAISVMLKEEKNLFSSSTSEALPAVSILALCP